MALQYLLTEIGSLHKELEKLKPLKKEDEDRLWQKFRLEWNYNSNHMEGNTLTYGQTELLLMFDKTTGDHDMREFEEMKAHDVVVNLIRAYASDKTRELTESDIRQWNKTILVKPFWSDAQTTTGQRTRKLITPGEYKKEPNSVLLPSGEMFHYASPEETPALMHDLIEWYRKESRDKALHPVALAALLHYKFVRIHPFDDSNGRTARLLMNYVLLKNDYPPVIIKSADKKTYLFALNKADTGDLNSFVEYICNQIIWSLNISIDAAQGKSIEDVDDIDKEIEIWKREKLVRAPNPIAKSSEIILNLFNSGFKEFFTYFMSRISAIDEVFISKRIWIQYDFGQPMGHEISNEKDWGLVILTGQVDRAISGNNIQLHRKDFVGFNIQYQGYKSNPTLDIFVSCAIKFEFQPYYYQLEYNGSVLEKIPYSNQIAKAKIDSLCRICLKQLFNDVKLKTADG